MGDDTTVVVYGLSTEGYCIAHQLAVRGFTVYIVDEVNSSALILNKEIARTYPNVAAIKEDEPIMPLEPLSDAVAKADYLFFAPRIRVPKHNIQSDLKSLFKDAVTSLRSGASVVFCAPVGMGESEENIVILEHVTGLGAGKQVFYYYYPLEVDHPAPTVIGSVDAKEDPALSGMLSPDPKKPKKFVTLSVSEHMHASDIMIRLARVYSAIDLGTSVSDDATRAEMALSDQTIRDLYVDVMVNGTLDMWLLDAAATYRRQMARPLVLHTRALDLYINHMIDNIKQRLRDLGLKPNRTNAIVLWSYDPDSMRGDKKEMHDVLIKRLSDNLGEVETYEKPGQWIFNINQTAVLVSCSQKDFERASKVKKRKPNTIIVVKANHLCETFI